MKKSLNWMLAAILTFCGTVMMLTSCTDNSDNSAVVPPDPQELADYTIIYYGHGGDPSLDFFMVENLKQFHAADAASYGKVKIAVEYKFCSPEPFQGMIQKMLKLMKSEDDKKEIEAFYEAYKDKAGHIYRYVVDPSKKLDDQLGDKYRYGALESDISNPDSLTNFINWAAKACPAKRYLLVLSDHGAGYMPHSDLPYTPAAKTRGVVYDSKSKNSFTLQSLTAAIEAADIHVDALYFDACLMNSLEYLFELKDAVDYVVASSFVVPGVGGNYSKLVNLLAKNGDDIESALAGYNKACVDHWDATVGAAIKESFFDMTVTRTSGLATYGEKIRAFTDLLLKAYQSGDEELCKKIDNSTANALKIDKDHPYYDLLIYALLVTIADPDLFESAYNDLKACYEKNCLVSHQTSRYLSAEGITASILLGWEGQYEKFAWMKADDEWKVLMNSRYKPDGTCENHFSDYLSTEKWNSTFEKTYEQTKFDKATGWSRWIKANHQRPTVMSLATEGYDSSISEANPEAYITQIDFMHILGHILGNNPNDPK